MWMDKQQFLKKWASTSIALQAASLFVSAAWAIPVQSAADTIQINEASYGLNLTESARVDEPADGRATTVSIPPVIASIRNTAGS